MIAARTRDGILRLQLIFQNWHVNYRIIRSCACSNDHNVKDYSHETFVTL